MNSNICDPLEISIIIPCYNEENYIYKTLMGLSFQEGVSDTEIIVADANSNDNTSYEIEKAIVDFPHLNIKVIEGGKVSYGRNQGVLHSKYDYLLFIDADVLLQSRDILKETFKHRKNYEIITCKQMSIDNNYKSMYLWSIFNTIRSLMPETFCTGCYFFIPKEKFISLGGFDETVTNSEDYLLSRKVPKRKFLILERLIGQDSRRFEKIGYWGFLKIVILNYINRHNINYFRKDVGYWG